MGIEYYGYGWIKVAGEAVHLVVCETCSQIIAMTEEERNSTEGSVLDYLEERVACCDNPQYAFHGFIGKFPK